MSLSGMGSTGFPGFGAEATGAKLTNFTSASVILSSDSTCLPNWYPSGSLSSVMSGSRVTSLLMVSARVFLIPLTYLKLRVYFDASSTPQLLTLSFLVFLSKKDFNGR